MLVTSHRNQLLQDLSRHHASPFDACAEYVASCFGIETRWTDSDSRLLGLSRLSHPLFVSELHALSGGHRLTFSPCAVYRDILLLLGVCSVSKRSCSTILRRGKAGTAIVIVIGGATESLRAHPGTNDLTLKRRMGFVKIALREGYVWSLFIASVVSEADAVLVLLQSQSGSRLFLWRE